MSINYTFSVFKLAIPLLISLIIHTSCKQETKKNAVIKLSKETIKSFHSIRLDVPYTKKTIDLQSVADVEYIQLETNDNSLIDNIFEAEITDSCIIVCNIFKGDVIIFDRKGHLLSHFNNKGQSGSEYLRICSWTYDPHYKEIYILDNISGNRLLVYSINGKFKRSFRFPNKQKIRTFYNTIYNYDDKKLFVQKTDQTSWKEKEIDPNDYVLISKENGNIIDTIKSIKKIVSTYFYSYHGNIMNVTMVPTKTICSDGSNFIISDTSSDTIFILDRNKSIKPLIFRTPSLSNTEQPLVLESYFRNENYLFGQIMFFNFKPNAPKILESSRGIGIDLQTNEVFEPILTNQDAPKVNFFEYLINLEIKCTPKNLCIIPIEANDLQDLLSKNQLKGKLKEIAQAQNVEDNPVLMILNFNRK